MEIVVVEIDKPKEYMKKTFREYTIVWMKM